MTPSPAFIFKKEWKQVKNLIERIETRLDGWGAKLEEKNIEYPVDLICFFAPAGADLIRIS